ncbi:MAG: T9SS type A sorting domain-containing protein [Phaeodactylibacter sp.]|nr:T9SS type A sorting domain-containing protein [Phaeodactylibacter sp.]
MYLFPKPAPKDTEVTLCFGQSPQDPIQLKICDLHQQQVLNLTIPMDSGQSYLLNLSGIPRGSYYLHLSTGQQFGIQRLIII